MDNKILENVFEMTLYFAEMQRRGKIALETHFKDYMDSNISFFDDVKNNIFLWAKEFEEKHPDRTFNYSDEIHDFAYKKFVSKGWINSKGYWTIETWDEQDLADSLRGREIPVTDEAISDLRNACEDLFDDKSYRNEMIDAKVCELFDL